MSFSFDLLLAGVEEHGPLQARLDAFRGIPDADFEILCAAAWATAQLLNRCAATTTGERAVPSSKRLAGQSTRPVG
jgi:hypothetical protein